MHSLREVVQWQTYTGTPRTVGGVTVTPQSQALALHTPFFNWIWNRPVAVLVERGGLSERVPVIDVTRVAQLMMLGMALMMFVVLATRRR